jgi:integrase/recombinase XerD
MKKTQKINILSHELKNFFSDYLPRLRGMSPNTIHSYRDCLLLLLKYISTQKRCPVTKIDIEDFDAKKIIEFLQMLEDNRHNSISTRNIRLSAIHVFFQYVAYNHPEEIEHCQQILAVPFKRASHRVIEYLEYEEIQAVFSAVDRSTEDGNRDYALLVTMFNTGARVQEIIDLRVNDLQLVKPYQLRLMGKGRKERICPLWEKTAQLLQEFLAMRSNTQNDEHVFLNHRKQALTRFGVRYLLAKYCDLARESTPTLVGKRLHPHSMRHSTAIHLLKSGVDLVTISRWLGHTDINTTYRYMSIDINMKREAINKAVIDENSTTVATWRSDASILRWLESL